MTTIYFTLFYLLLYKNFILLHIIIHKLFDYRPHRIDWKRC